MKFDNLLKQIDFIKEIDKVKYIQRKTKLFNSDRNENDAEHSWHLAMMAILLSEYAADPEMDLLKVVKMVLIHDLVEIDAGDTFCYDEEGYKDKEEREKKAAKRLFNMLPTDQAQEILSLWREFEDLNTPEARFAACLDRFQPLILNYNTKGHTWQIPGVTKEDVFKRNSLLKENASELWKFAEELIEDSVRKGFLKP